MELITPLVIGLLYAAGLYMMMRRSFVKLVIGLLMIGHGTNLLIFTSAGLVRGKPPLIDPGAKVLPAGTTDPLAPALILTAIVISFAVVSYTMVLVKRTYQELGTDDLAEMRTTDR
ncbi:MAG: Na+/H+ antiporter subunit C [Planctomycetota bacterium]